MTVFYLRFHWPLLEQFQIWELVLKREVTKPSLSKWNVTLDSTQFIPLFTYKELHDGARTLSFLPECSCLQVLSLPSSFQDLQLTTAAQEVGYPNLSHRTPYPSGGPESSQYDG